MLTVSPGERPQTSHTMMVVSAKVFSSRSKSRSLQEHKSIRGTTSLVDWKGMSQSEAAEFDDSSAMPRIPEHADALGANEVSNRCVRQWRSHIPRRWSR